MAWRRAIWPTSRWPSLVNATTDGVVRPPSSFAITLGSPPSMTATTEFVVPRSMPMTRPILRSPEICCGNGRFYARTEVGGNVEAGDCLSSKVEEGHRADPDDEVALLVHEAVAPEALPEDAQADLVVALAQAHDLPGHAVAAHRQRLGHVQAVQRALEGLGGHPLPIGELDQHVDRADRHLGAVRERGLDAHQRRTHVDETRQLRPEAPGGTGQ